MRMASAILYVFVNWIFVGGGILRACSSQKFPGVHQTPTGDPEIMPWQIQLFSWHRAHRQADQARDK